MKAKLITSLILALAASTTVYAAPAERDSTSTFPKERPLSEWSESRPHVGVIAGVTAPEGSFDSTAEYGIDVGYQPYIPFGLGAELTHSRTRSDVDELLDRTSLLVKGTYHFGGTTMLIKDSYVGVGVGAIAKNDGTDLAAAPLVGFDIPLKDESQKGREFFSLGAHAKYMVVSSNDPDGLSMNAVLKYWY
jgi:hypothetical protein